MKIVVEKLEIKIPATVRNKEIAHYNCESCDFTTTKLGDCTKHEVETHLKPEVKTVAERDWVKLDTKVAFDQYIEYLRVKNDVGSTALANSQRKQSEFTRPSWYMIDVIEETIFHRDGMDELTMVYLREVNQYTIDLSVDIVNVTILRDCLLRHFNPVPEVPQAEVQDDGDDD